MSKKVLLIISHTGGSTFKGEAFLQPDGTFIGSGPLEKIEGVTLEVEQGVRETTDDDMFPGDFKISKYRTFESSGMISWKGTIK